MNRKIDIPQNETLMSYNVQVYDVDEENERRRKVYFYMAQNWYCWCKFGLFPVTGVLGKIDEDRETKEMVDGFDLWVGTACNIILDTLRTAGCLYD